MTVAIRFPGLEFDKGGSFDAVGIPTRVYGQGA